MPRLFFAGLFCWLTFTSVLRADFAQDLARIHAEAMGGRERIDALKTLKATGVTRNERGDLKFVLWAGRPNKIRTELTSGTRTIAQAWGGGEEEPWSADSESRRVTIMNGEGADAFKVESEFDDPLIAGKDRKVSLDYVGEVTQDGRELLKVVVTQNFSQTSFIYLDPASYLIVRRDVVRRRQGVEIVLRTDYSDFRAVEGVLLPHRLSVLKNGKRLHETVIDRVEANVKLPVSLFTVPSLASAR